jgi:hypothetical protein
MTFHDLLKVTLINILLNDLYLPYMKLACLLLFSSLVHYIGWAQLVDDFSDGDFTNNPTWIGTDSDFIINAADKLQLNSAVAGVSYLSTPNLLSTLDDKEWRFDIRLNFSPSASNKAEVYLAGGNPDVSTYPDGLYLLFGEGGSLDAIRLFNRVGGVNTQILEGTAGAIANAFDISVKVTYGASGDWSLFVDNNGGNAFVLDATANFPTVNLQPQFGFLCTYTVSNATRFYFDNIYVGDIIIDIDPPELISATAISSTEVEVLFNEGVELTSAENTANYSADLGLGNPISASRDPGNLAKVTLTYATPFTIGEVYTLTTENIEDFSGNVSGNLTATFQYIEAQTPVYGDLIINEFMPRESPAVGLPARQYVEIYNRSTKYFHVNGWKLSDRTSTGTIQNAWIYPGEYLLLVPTSALVDYPNAINVTNWGTLNNTGDDIILETNDGFVVDKLSYTDAWYQDPSASGGGVSIERINPELNCSGSSNWRASIQPIGGTPGSVNSVINLTPDTTPPNLVNTFVFAPDTLELTFNEGMDSLSLELMNITISPTLTIAERIIDAVYPQKMRLRFDTPIEAGVIYQFTLDNFQDCSGNPANATGTFILPEAADGSELIINEILHDVYTGGSDFVELYNKSDKYIDLIGWELANHSNGGVANNRVINYNYIIAPQDYVVITKDSLVQQQTYPFTVQGKFIQLASLPAYNNDSSTVYLVFNDSVVDKVSYTKEWHFGLLQSKKGVSLERFTFDGKSNDQNNWHSASETVGFATPGRVNSQVYSVGVDGELNLSSGTISPDGDGYQDVLLINYQLSEPELLGDLVIYDDKGRKIRKLLESHLLDTGGTIKWDGTRDDQTKASIGVYIIVFEAFNATTGDTFKTRKTVTVAGQL